MPTAHVNGVDLAYDRAGEGGDPTVLVHGSLADRSGWAKVVPGLSGSVQVLTYDRRGYGESSSSPNERAVRTDAADLAALLEAVDLYPAHVVAHSYGGAVALRLAADRPEMVRSLALHEPPFFGLLADRVETAAEGRRFLDRIPSLRQQIERGDRAGAARAVLEPFSVVPGAWDRLAPDVRATLAGRTDRWSEEYGDPDALRPDLSSFSDLLLPVLLTTGERSPTFLHHICDDLAHRLPNPTAREIPEAGHFPQSTAPSSYVGLLLTFLLDRNVPSA